MNCNTTHYRANSSSVPGDPTCIDAIGAVPANLGRNIDIVARPLAVLFGGAAAIAQLWIKRELTSGVDAA